MIASLRCLRADDGDKLLVGAGCLTGTGVLDWVDGIAEV